MDIQAISSLSRKNNADGGDPGQAQAASPAMPSATHINAFDRVMKTDATDCADKAQCPESNKSAGSAGLEEVIEKVLELVRQLLATLDGSQSGDKSAGGSIGGGGGVTPVEGSGSGGSAGAGGLIPPPTEHIQQLNLGGKPVTVGGDGSASAEEVAATSQSIQQLYQNSPTFKDMIDNSSDPSFEVSVGRRDDNTSWGNTGGKVFMNINNIAPGSSDAFQSLLGHEFAHASIDLGHGNQMEQVQSAVAREA